MNQYEASSVSAGYDQETEVGVSAEVPGTGVEVDASTTVQTKMMIGSSSSSQEYNAATKSGSDMSAFATITSWNYDVFLKDVTSFPPEFKDQIIALKSDSSDANMRHFFSSVSSAIICLRVVDCTQFIALSVDIACCRVPLQMVWCSLGQTTCTQPSLEARSHSNQVLQRTRIAPPNLRTSQNLRQHLSHLIS